MAESEHDQLLRRALLQRIATAVKIAATTPSTGYTCCWMSYTGPCGEPWAWRLCNPAPHAGMLVDPPCEHLHHRHEIFLAGAGG